MEEDTNGVENDPETETNNLANINVTEEKKDDAVPTFDFEENSWRSDFTIIVEGTKLYVAKNILSLASPVFDRMFGSGFKEGSCEELDLPEKKLDDMKEFLRCIYPNTLVLITMENALTLLPIFDEYQVLHLKARCESVLVDNVGNGTHAKELFQRLRDADMYQLKLLRQKCISIASRKTQTELEEAKKECRPPAEDLVEILENITTQLRKNIADLEEANDNLSARVKELQSDAELGKHAEELAVSNATLSKEIDVWKSYVSANIKESKELAFEECMKWKEMHVVLTIPVSNGYRASVLKEIWDIPIKISASSNEYSRFYGKKYVTEEYLRLELHVNNGTGLGSIRCQINIKYDLVNMQPYGKNESFISKRTYDGGVISMDLKKIDDLKNAENGFIHEGNVFLIVHLYMTEPNKLEPTYFL